MSGSRSRNGFVRTTLVGGLMFLVPVVAIVAILGKALSLLDKVTTPLARFLSVHDVAGIPAPRIVAAVILALICFLAGLLARTRIARSSVGWLETNLLSNIPGYTYLKSMSESVAGVEDREGFQVVLVSIEEEAWQIAFLMERMEDGQVVVFVPGVPDAKSGSVYMIAPDRIRPLDASMKEAVRCLHRLGRGSAALIKNVPGSRA